MTAGSRFPTPSHHAFSQNSGDQVEPHDAPASLAQPSPQQPHGRSRNVLSASTAGSASIDAFFDKLSLGTTAPGSQRESSGPSGMPKPLAPPDSQAAANSSGTDHLIQNRFAPSSAHLEALDLAVTDKALSVPAMQLFKFHGIHDIEALFLGAHLASRDLLRDEFGTEYMLQKAFSHGAFGAVRLAKKKDRVVDQVYAVKEIKLADIDAETMNYDYLQGEHSAFRGSESEAPVLTKSTDEQRLLAEVQTMLLAKSPLSPHAVLMTESSAYLFLPPLSGDAFDFISRFSQFTDFDSTIDLRTTKQLEDKNSAPLTISMREATEQTTIGLMQSALKVLPELHAAGYAHRDIKPENFLYDQLGHFYLSDFGLATKVSDRGFRGTVSYMPFEALIRGTQGQADIIASATDIWAVGATAMTVLVGDNFTWAALEAARSESSPERQQRLYLEQSLVYKQLYDELHEFTDPDQALYFLTQQQGERQPMAQMFGVLLYHFPKMYQPIMAAMAPDPKKRPSATAFATMLQKAFGPEQKDLSRLVKSHELNLASGKAFEATHPRTALKNAVRRNAYQRWQGLSTHSKQSLHLSILEKESGLVFKPEPFVKLEKIEE